MPFKKLKSLFYFRIKYGLTYGKVYTSSEEIDSVAIWLPTEKPGMPFSQMVRCGVLLSGFTIGISNVLRMMSIEKYLAAIHLKIITESHWHLSPIAIDPAFQGQGIGSSLMKPMFEKFDNEKKSCFLETQTPENVEIYEHLGFKKMGTGIIPKTDIPNWSMLREPCK